MDKTSKVAYEAPKAKLIAMAKPMSLMARFSSESEFYDLEDVGEEW